MADQVSSNEGGEELSRLQQQLEKSNRERDALREKLRLVNEKFAKQADQAVAASSANTTTGNREVALVITTGVFASGWMPSGPVELPNSGRRPEQIGKIMSIDAMAKHIAGMAEVINGTISQRWPLVNEKANKRSEEQEPNETQE